MSAWGNKSTLGPGHDGKPKPGFIAKEDGSDAIHTHHQQPHAVRGQERQQSDNLGLARASRAGKHHVDVPVHLGHRSRTSPLPGMQHLTDVNEAPVADAPNVLDPLTPSQYGKRLPAPAIHDGMKTAPDYAHDHAGSAAAVMNEAHAAAAPDDVANLGRRIGSLPESTTENGGDDV